MSSRNYIDGSNDRKSGSIFVNKKNVNFPSFLNEQYLFNLQ